MAVQPHSSDAEPLPGIERRQRADAARNRERVLEAASLCFRERGLEVGVSDIAERAGVGRATLFRNFPTKSDLIMAVLVERIREGVETARALLRSGEPHGALVVTLIGEIAGRQQVDRALFEGIGADEFMNNEDIRTAHTEIVAVLDELIALDREAGTVRDDIGGLDVLMLVKGACSVACEMGGDEGRRAYDRQMALVRSAISASAAASCPLVGKPLTPEEFEASHRCV